MECSNNGCCNINFDAHILDKGLEWVYRNIQDMRHLKKKLAKTNEDLDDLMAKRNDVAIRLQRELSIKINHKPLAKLDEWFGRVERVKNKFEEVSADILTPKKGSCYPVKSPIRKRRQGRCLRELDTKIENLKNVDFDEFVVALPPRRVIEQPSEPLVGVENKVKQLFDHLKNDEVGVIGVHGMPGTGKTALLIDLNNKLASSDLKFDMVILVPLSGIAHDLSLIINKIGHRLDFEGGWESKCQDDKASDIYAKLKEYKFALLLDGVEERIDLKKLGVSIRNPVKGSKVVFTTRSQKVCDLMRAEKEVHVECLSAEEAWALFSSNVKDGLIDHPEMQKLAKAVCEKCRGLPGLLIETALAMASCKTKVQWENGLEQLVKKDEDRKKISEQIYRAGHITLASRKFQCLPKSCV